MIEQTTMDLFSQQSEKFAPLAERLRPKTLEDYVGQNHLVGENKLITKLMKGDYLPSLILWGPPGSGKTTLAHLLAQKQEYRFIALSAVTSGIKEVKEIIVEAKDHLNLYRKKTLLFIDEIHRFNKAQQDAFLPHVENGTIVLIGATTENPSFEVIGALLSRCKVIVLNKLEKEDLEKILQTALQDKKINDSAKDLLLEAADGDARRMLNTLEIAISLVGVAPCGHPGQAHGPTHTISISDIEMALQKKTLLYDKSGEEHYNIISAFIKSMRGSDPDAAVYYLARMLEAGEEPLFLARRMVIFASEDIGNADPQAVQVAVACMQSFDFVGMPEGWIPLAQCATYLASAPKSNASYAAYKMAKADVMQYGTLPIPIHLRNAPTKLMKSLDYGKGYQYAHNAEGNIVDQQHLPDALRDKKYYQPTNNGHEKNIQEWLAKVSSLR